MILEFKIDGMTCVNCSSTIENVLLSEYKESDKGLVSVQIALLTHKMRIIFDKQKYDELNITPEMIKEDIEMVGFSADLLEIIFNDQDDLLMRVESEGSIIHADDELITANR